MWCGACASEQGVMWSVSKGLCDQVYLSVCQLKVLRIGNRDLFFPIKCPPKIITVYLRVQSSSQDLGALPHRLITGWPRLLGPQAAQVVELFVHVLLDAHEYLCTESTTVSLAMPFGKWTLMRAVGMTYLPTWSLSEVLPPGPQLQVAVERWLLLGGFELTPVLEYPKATIAFKILALKLARQAAPPICQDFGMPGFVKLSFHTVCPNTMTHA